jgi:hypothetical protein
MDIVQRWPTRPASGAALYQATTGKGHALNAKIHKIESPLDVD